MKHFAVLGTTLLAHLLLASADYPDRQNETETETVTVPYTLSDPPMTIKAYTVHNASESDDSSLSENELTNMMDLRITMKLEVKDFGQEFS